VDRHRYRVVFRGRPSEVFFASGYEEGSGLVEFFDADIAEDEAAGTRVFQRSSIVEVVQLDD
jgi:hypothetical protein